MQLRKYLSTVPVGEVKMRFAEQIVEAIIYCEQFSDEAIVYYNTESNEFGWKASDCEENEDELDLFSLDSHLAYDDWDEDQEAIPNDMNALIQAWEISYDCKIDRLVNEIIDEYRNIPDDGATNQPPAKNEELINRIATVYERNVTPCQEAMIKSEIISGLLYAEKNNACATICQKISDSGVIWYFVPTHTILSTRGQFEWVLPPSASLLSFGQITNIPACGDQHNEESVVKTWEQTYLTSINYLTMLIFCGYPLDLINHRHLSGYILDVMLRNRAGAQFKFSDLTPSQRTSLAYRANNLAWNALFEVNALGNGYHIHTLYYPATDTLRNVIMQETPCIGHRACIELFVAYAPKNKFAKMSRSKLVNQVESETGFFSLNYIINLAMDCHDQGITMSFDFSSLGLFAAN